MDTKIKKYLEKHNVRYEVLEHRKVYTAFTAAETQHLKTNEVVKAVLVKLSKKVGFARGADIITSDLLLTAIPSSKQVDFKKIDKFLDTMQTQIYKNLIKNPPAGGPKMQKPVKSKTSLAKEKDISSKLKIKVGLLSPFPLYDLPIFLDKKLIKNKFLIISAGSYTQSLKCKTSDYIKLVAPLQGNFSK